MHKRGPWFQLIVIKDQKMKRKVKKYNKKDIKNPYSDFIFRMNVKRIPHHIRTKDLIEVTRKN